MPFLVFPFVLQMEWEAVFVYKWLQGSCNCHFPLTHKVCIFIQLGLVQPGQDLYRSFVELGWAWRAGGQVLEAHGERLGHRHDSNHSQPQLVITIKAIYWYWIFLLLLGSSAVIAAWDIFQVVRALQIIQSQDFSLLSQNFKFSPTLSRHAQFF